MMTPRGLFEANSVFPSRHIRSRALVESSLNRIHAFVTSYNPKTSSSSELEIRLQTLEDVYKKFNDIQEAILDKAETEEAIEDVEKHAVNFENTLFATKTKIRDILNRRKQLPVEQQSGTPLTVNQNAVKLPAIQLASFDGDVL